MHKDLHAFTHRTMIIDALSIFTPLQTLSELSELTVVLSVIGKLISELYT